MLLSQSVFFLSKADARQQTFQFYYVSETFYLCSLQIERKLIKSDIGGIHSETDSYHQVIPGNTAEVLAANRGTDPGIHRTGPEIHPSGKSVYFTLL